MKEVEGVEDECCGLSGVIIFVKLGFNELIDRIFVFIVMSILVFYFCLKFVLER